VPLRAQGQQLRSIYGAWIQRSHGLGLKSLSLGAQAASTFASVRVQTAQGVPLQSHVPVHQLARQQTHLSHDAGMMTRHSVSWCRMHSGAHGVPTMMHRAQLADQPRLSTATLGRRAAQSTPISA
jgi:hypothetical protein